MIYLDYAATHPMTPLALEAYLEAAALVGNPASVHGAGQAAREKLEEGRSAVAQVLGVDPRCLICNSGATEGNNHAILGLARHWQEQHGCMGHLVSTPTEHAATLAPLRWLEQQGWALSWLTPQKGGLYDPAELDELLRPDTALVSVHLANNELGSIQDLEGFGQRCRAAGVPLHCDAVQGAGVLALQPLAWGVSALTLSAHKWGGPRGVGFLYLERGLHLPALLMGGGQEGGQRAGTQNTAGVYAAGVALRQAEAERPETYAHMHQLKTQAEQQLAAKLPHSRLNHPAGPQSSPKVLSLTLPNTDGEALLMNLDMLGISVSSGSACSAGTMQPSHVLLALGLPEAEARASLRLSFGRPTSSAEVTQAVAAIAQAAQWSHV